ncbi:putative metallopeptidase-like protein [Kineococcus xinjiangensis]|uniref:Putative metallopeptidase-like protein n=1 Tax=Kineococcus xinjiangensis TaxID=512762 RepID=A0A2S6IGS9_9ACTN|nr:VWA-like domain-containing protein [Kineococcus xinjiangensis]PPK93386.1 putative metallopeptidase-like protein [Kineococcus xinjiangensis]
MNRRERGGQRTPGRGGGAAAGESLEERAALRLAAGRARACDLMPYLSDALYAVKAVPTTAIPTAGIDPRWRMHYNPEFVLTLDVAEVVGVWLHEVGHPLRGHHERFEALAEPQERHPLFNQAGDCAINDDLRAAGIRLPALKAWYPERVPGAGPGMTAEQIYRLLVAGPAGRRLAAASPSLLLLPAALRHDHGVPTRVLGHTREAFLTGLASVVLRGPDGAARTGEGGSPATGPVTVHDERTVSFDLRVRLPAGEHTVEVTCGGTGASAVLEVTAPTIALRPDHLPRRRGEREKVVVAGRETRFTAASVVEVLDAGGAPGAAPGVVPGVVSNVAHVSATYLTFDLGPVPDGAYLVRVGDGGEVVQAVLPVGLPHLDLSPGRLPSGYAVPAPVALVGDDVTLDATSTVDLLDPAAGTAPLAGATGRPTVAGPGVLNVELTRSLPDGRYLVVVTTAGERAVATLTVGADRPEGTAPLPATAGHDDCGSGAGGPRRPWEGDSGGRDAAGNDDGSVDAGRAELIRRQTAQNVLEHARSRGSVPAGLQRWAESTLTPVVDWRRELASVTRRVSAHVAGMRDYSYARPSRRSSSTPGVVLPAMRQPRPPRAAEVVDTSASVTDEMLSRVHAETEAIIRRCHGAGVQVIACDAAAGRARLVRRMRDLTMVGGGGTDMRVGIAAAAALRPRVDLVIVATDGDTPWPEDPPPENPDATYVALLLDGDREGVPRWMRRIVVERDGPDGR